MNGRGFNFKITIIAIQLAFAVILQYSASLLDSWHFNSFYFYDKIGTDNISLESAKIIAIIFGSCFALLAWINARTHIQRDKAKRTTTIANVFILRGVFYFLLIANCMMSIESIEIREKQKAFQEIAALDESTPIKIAESEWKRAALYAERVQGFLDDDPTYIGNLTKANLITNQKKAVYDSLYTVRESNIGEKNSNAILFINYIGGLTLIFLTLGMGISTAILGDRLKRAKSANSADRPELSRSFALETNTESSDSNAYDFAVQASKPEFENEANNNGQLESDGLDIGRIAELIRDGSPANSLPEPESRNDIDLRKKNLTKMDSNFKLPEKHFVLLDEWRRLKKRPGETKAIKAWLILKHIDGYDKAIKDVRLIQDYIAPYLHIKDNSGLNRIYNWIVDAKQIKALEEGERAIRILKLKRHVAFRAAKQEVQEIVSN